MSQENNPQGNRNINIGQGNYIENLYGNYYQKNSVVDSGNTPSNLTKAGSANFVGREEKLTELHQKLQENEQVCISAIAGMGGIGKTELALQYALNYGKDYSGSICWFSLRGENLVTQIIEFARSYLNIFPPQELESDKAKLNYCWRNWRSEPSLIILDDVANYGEFYRENIEPYLPPATSKIKLLMTSRERPGTNISRIDLDVLSETKAIELLAKLIGQSKIEAEAELAEELCQWLGYLPLGIELVGRYIALDSTLTIKKTLRRLDRRKLDARALLDPEQADMTAQLGVATAFDLSWSVLSPDAQVLGCYLSLFGAAPFPWLWVEKALIKSEDESEQEDEREDLEELRNRQLTNLSLIKVVQDSNNPDQYNFQLHPLVAQYFRAKLEAQTSSTVYKQSFCGVMNLIAQSISFTPVLEEIQAFTIAIPHLSHVTTELTDFIDDESLIEPFLALSEFYYGQGIYKQAELLWEQCLSKCQKRFGEQHPDVAASLNNLANLYKSQGKYEAAEPLYQEALELLKQLLGEQHPDVATSLNNLADLYQLQGKYEAAEPLYQKALELRKQLLGEQHPDVATSLNNLAKLYQSQSKYDTAEPLYQQALELLKQLLGEQHPDVATCLDNLAGLYESQGKYEAAEPLYQKALELRKQLLGAEHPQVAVSLNNLAKLYQLQGKYDTAEPFCLEALKLSKQLLGENHPQVAVSLNNLAKLYQSQGKYDTAEPLYQQALELLKQLLGEQHPDVATCLDNLAGLYESQGKYEAAEPLYQKALELRKQLLGEEHPQVANSLNNLAGLYKSQGKYEAAEPLYLQALELSKQLLGAEHPQVAVSLNNLAMLYQSQGKYEAAEPLYLQAIEIAEAVLGENHPNTQTMQNNFTYCMMNKYLAMPETEMRQILPEEVCEELLQYKKTMNNEQSTVNSQQSTVNSQQSTVNSQSTLKAKSTILVQIDKLLTL
ncbi:MAG: tetratricopeptide repeat protein [Cyanobacteria bacterium P01_G01_bin.39]